MKTIENKDPPPIVPTQHYPLLTSQNSWIEKRLSTEKNVFYLLVFHNSLRQEFD